MTTTDDQVVFDLMTKYLNGRTQFDIHDFTAMINSLSVEEYMAKRAAIAAFSFGRGL